MGLTRRQAGVVEFLRREAVRFEGEFSVHPYEVKAFSIKDVDKGMVSVSITVGVAGPIDPVLDSSWQVFVGPRGGCSVIGKDGKSVNVKPYHAIVYCKLGKGNTA